MPKTEYDGYIKELNTIATYDGKKATAEYAADEIPALDTLSSLPRFSALPSKDMRFIASALAAVYHDCTPISDWDENDYTYIGVIAEEMNAGNLQLDTLKWQGAGSESTKAQRFVAQALAARMKAERDVASERALKDGQDVDEVHAELDNDHGFV
ncbi:hypothetical protein K503DRAFT_772160 [Rhizopogon vinicolor AM-OR11-026]|uniref:Uncharacterized protein n=1 Tax=Rhizopogon vinicolor AM-OR11-026 TaxID=1314800 RepID=A0A1B7MW20_9AGAM|nr:hypothetical protein K503DRAFT_772160 [Rhizopogon vinicolor AM-OR11-026]